MNEAEIDPAFTPEVDAETARALLASLARPVAARLKPGQRGAGRPGGGT